MAFVPSTHRPCKRTDSVEETLSTPSVVEMERVARAKIGELSRVLHRADLSAEEKIEAIREIAERRYV